MTESDQEHYCKRGGARPGCGRKPGIKTRPIRLPVWMVEALEAQGDPREAIVKACCVQYQISPPDFCQKEKTSD